MSRLPLLALLLTAAAAPLLAQSPEQPFRAAVQHKTLFLRGFVGGDHVRWHWNGTAVVEDPGTFHAVSAIRIEKVKLKSDHITLTGKHLALGLPSSGATSVVDEASNLVIDVDLRGADRDALLPQLPDLLFFSDQASAIAALPKPFHANRRNAMGVKKPAPQDPNCDCGDSSSDKKAAAKPADKHARMTPPRPISTPAPVFSEQARRKKFSGNVQVYLVVDPNGDPRDIWVTRPVGMGLDAQAADAVSKYKFQPATRDGKPVATDIYIDVNFQIF